MNNVQVKLYSFPVIITNDSLRAEQKIQRIVSGDVYMMNLFVMHQGKFNVMSFIITL